MEFELQILTHDTIHCTKLIARDYSRHISRRQPPLVSPRNDVRQTKVEILYR